jgi:hypothetical protein
MLCSKFLKRPVCPSINRTLRVFSLYFDSTRLGADLATFDASTSLTATAHLDAMITHCLASRLPVKHLLANFVVVDRFSLDNDVVDSFRSSSSLSATQRLVVIDATASEQVAPYYHRLLQHNIAVVTPNKKGIDRDWIVHPNRTNLHAHAHTCFVSLSNTRYRCRYRSTSANTLDMALYRQLRPYRDSLYRYESTGACVGVRSFANFVRSWFIESMSNVVCVECCRRRQ